MQEKRHAADYDPTAVTTKSEVLIDVQTVEQVIAGFENASLRDRRAFAAWVMFKERKS